MHFWFLCCLFHCCVECSLVGAFEKSVEHSHVGADGKSIDYAYVDPDGEFIESSLVCAFGKSVGVVSIVVETEEVTVMAICKLVDALDATLLKPGYFERSIDWTQVKSSTD